MKQRSSENLTSFPAATAYCHLARIFRPFAGRSGISFLAILVVPEAGLAFYYGQAAELLIAGEASYNIRRFDAAVLVQTVKRGSAKYDHILGDSQQHRPSVWVFECADDVPPEFRAAADIYAVIGKPDLKVFRAAIYRMCGTVASVEDAEFVSSQSWKRNAATFRKGRSLKRTLQLLRKTLPQSPSLSTSAPANRDQNFDIESLIGYGAARDWGLQFIEDLAGYRAGRLQWADLDPGVLLSGPSGCGKTRYAEALAKSTGMPLICGSPAKWQEAGHLGDYLREMRKSFDEALKYAPAILLIDEIDGFGNRASLGWDRDYQRQVTNAALGCLDGAIRREGVVVIGTTNFPEHLDAALLRPGRLDRHLQILPPNADARIAIVEHYMGLKLPAEVSVNVAQLTDQWSGAQLEQLARDARRVARRENRTAEPADVVALLPKIYPMPAERLLATATHECGHAIVGFAVGRQIEKIEIADHYSHRTNDLRLGGVHFLSSTLQRRTAAYYLDEIVISLGGIAAEQEVFGNFDDGSGALPTSDLVRATQVATLMEAAYGMGETLISEVLEDRTDIAKLRLRSSHLWKRVDARLFDQMKRAKNIVRLNRSILDSLVDHLITAKCMSGQELNRFFCERGFRPTQADTVYPAASAAMRISQ